ncbi:MAG: hypothetical protein KF819_28190 [Labilithrix sp.]|nr:hypothetical protein [Labilithrix sp.]
MTTAETSPKSLTPAQLALLVVIRRADEEEGGLWLADMDADEREALERLLVLGLIETKIDDDGAAWARVTWRGAEAVRDAGESDEA